MEESELIQRAYTAVLEHFIKTGRAPHYTELGTILGIKPDRARDVLHKTADSALACWFAGETDYVESWAPFSNLPTHYHIEIKGKGKWYGQ